VFVIKSKFKDERSLNSSKLDLKDEIPPKREFEAGQNQNFMKKREEKGASKSMLQYTVQAKRMPLEEVKDTAIWTNEEQRLLVDAVRKHGRDWDKVSESVSTRTPQ